MRILLVVTTMFLTAPAFVVFGQMESPVSIGGQVTAFGMLCWVLWFLLRKHIPSLHERFDKSLNTQQESFQGTLDDMAERHERWETQRHEDSKTLNEMLAEMRENCASAQSKWGSKDQGG